MLQQASTFPQVATLPRPAFVQIEPLAPAVERNRAASLFMSALVTLFVGVSVVALHPGLRTAAHALVNKDTRLVLSTVHGDLVGNGLSLTIAKVRAHDTLFLEIYEPKSDGGQRLLERIELPDHKDGYFNFNGEATNLAVDDINGDGQLEILVPTFDQNMVGHLNVYRYDEGSGAFTRSTM